MKPEITFLLLVVALAANAVGLVAREVIVFACAVATVCLLVALVLLVLH